MSLSTAGAVIRIRLVILFLTNIWLVFASLNLAIARFTIVLRDYAKPDFVIEL